ncbi:MAG: 50S ribosomal protein L7/L12 [bacterium]|nr:50S ribosomal protein L7/L12 [bacterium]
MAKLTKDEFIKAIEEMTVLDLADLVKALEEKFGVVAMAASNASPANAVAGATEAKEPVEEQTTFNVVLAGGGTNKIGVIKALREIIPTLGLVDAKNLAESAPKEVLVGVNKATAEEAKKKLEAAGAVVELK